MATVTIPQEDRSADAALGQRAAEAIFHGGLKAPYELRTSSAFARAAVSRLGELIGRQGLVKEMVEGAKQGAESLNVEAFHGVVEVVQNAEDQAATEVRIGMAREGRDDVLLLVHNGTRVEFHQLVAMSFAFLSTKREDAKATGRFGVGLKTLSRIATDLEIHGAPYHVEVETAGPRNIRAAGDIPGFYQRAGGDTLLRLRLVRGFDWADFEAWFRELGSDLLLFLNSVKALRLIDLRRAKPRQVGNYVVRRARPTAVVLPRGTSTLAARRTIVRDSAGREWLRVSASVPVPRDQRRKNKATGESTEISVAVQPGGGRGRIFAGLPLRVRPTLPLAINADFDPDTARFTVQEGAWNRWVLRRLVGLLEGVARHEAARNPALAWRWIPLIEEAVVPGQDWLTRELESVFGTLQRTLARSLVVLTGGETTRLSDLVYEDPTLSRLVTEEDLVRLRPARRPLLFDARDPDERWRAVLAELGGAERIDVAAAVAMFDWPESRPPEWFVGLASCALGAGVNLTSRPCVLLADGTAVRPPSRNSGEILVIDAGASRAAVSLGLAAALHPIYSGPDPDASVVRGWLQRESTLRPTASGRDTLNGLIRRDAPLLVNDEQLLLLREVLFSELKPDERRSLGPRVGGAILVDGYEFEAGADRRAKGRRRRILVSPGEAYLPAAIDASGKRSWPTAAANVPGLKWIAGRYRDVLTTAPDVPGARAVFTALGAAVTPRLVDRTAPDYKYDQPAFPRLPSAGTLQDEAVGALPRWVSHVRDERLSPDLELVVETLVALSVRTRRERARALLTTIVEHWRNDYADSADVQACYSDYGWKDVGLVPAAWLSRLASRPWLSNQKGQPRRPMALAVQTQRAVEVFGPDPSIYGWELGGLQPRHYAALEAMGVRTDPKVSDVIEALKELRAHDPAGSRLTTQRAAVLYDILADHCAVLQGEVRPDDEIGDMTIRQVRAAFGIGKAKGKGLIVTRSGWWSPQMVFRGRPIFGARRAFVPERRRADRLWEVLNVREPGVRDCVDVLREIAQHPLRDEDVGILIDTYRHLATIEPDDRSERESLARIPLWGGEAWLTARPIFAVDDPQVSAALAGHEPTWIAPVPVETLGTLPARLGVTILEVGLFSAVGIDGRGLAEGARIQERFRLAVGHLAARFARNDVLAFEQLRPGWRALEDALVALTPELGIEIRIVGRQEFTVPVAAHVQEIAGKLVFAARTDVVAGEEGGGGRAMASLFGRDTEQRLVDREKIALAWAAAWASAGEGLTAERVVLADDLETEPDPLEGLQEDVRRAQQWRKTNELLGKRGKKAAAAPSPLTHEPIDQSAGVSQTPIAMRYLKSMDNLVIGDVALVPGGKPRGTSKGTTKRRQLANPPSGDGEGQSPHGGQALLRAYSDGDREKLAVDVLRRILETDKRTLRDLRKVANLGADVVDNLKKYFEIKSAAGDMPDVVSLQYSELERSLERPAGHWFLVVVSGLEQGYETSVRFIADPLRHLTWADHGSVSLSGVRTARAVEIRLPAAPAAND